MARPTAASGHADGAVPRLLTFNAVKLLTTLSKTSIHRAVAEGRFPKPVKLGGHKVCFVESEIADYIRRLPRQDYVVGEAERTSADTRPGQDTEARP